MNKILIAFSVAFGFASVAQAQPSGPTAAAYQTALSKCSAGNPSNAQAFDACMKVQGFSAPAVPMPSMVGVPPAVALQPVPGTSAPWTPVPGLPAAAVQPAPTPSPVADPMGRAPKAIEIECRVAHGDGKFYEACLKSNGLQDVKPGNLVPPPALPGREPLPLTAPMVPPAPPSALPR